MKLYKRELYKKKIDIKNLYKKLFKDLYKRIIFNDFKTLFIAIKLN